MPADPGPPRETGELIDGDPSVELSSNRTALSLQRTSMSTDRTLMSVIRTSLSLISFGFTIYEAFRSLTARFPTELSTTAPRNLGVSLVALGILMLVLGLINHWQIAVSLQKRRARLFAIGIIRHAPQISMSTATIVAMLLLLIGIFCIVRILFHVGPI